MFAGTLTSHCNAIALEPCAGISHIQLNFPSFPSDPPSFSSSGLPLPHCPWIPSLAFTDDISLELMSGNTEVKAGETSLTLIFASCDTGIWSRIRKLEIGTVLVFCTEMRWM